MEPSPRFALVAGLAAWNVVVNKLLPERWYIPANLAAGAATAGIGRAAGVDCAELGLGPGSVRGARWGKALRLGPAGPNFEDLLWEALLDTNCDLTMAQTAEELADRYTVTREEADQVAVNSLSSGPRPRGTTAISTPRSPRS